MFGNDRDGGYRFYLILALPGLFTAGLFYRWNHWQFWVLALTVSGGFWLLFRLLSGRRPARKEWEQELEAIESQVSQLNLPEVKRRFERLLVNRELYRCQEQKPGSEDRERLALLPPSARDLFSRFSRIEQAYGDLVLDRSLIGASQFGDEFVVCGNTEETEIAVKRGEETCYELDGLEPREDLEHSYPSLYHFLLCNAHVVYPEAASEVGPES